MLGLFSDNEKKIFFLCQKESYIRCHFIKFYQTRSRNLLLSSPVLVYLFLLPYVSTVTICFGQRRVNAFFANLMTSPCRPVQIRTLRQSIKLPLTKYVRYKTGVKVTAIVKFSDCKKKRSKVVSCDFIGQKKTVLMNKLSV